MSPESPRTAIAGMLQRRTLAQADGEAARDLAASLVVRFDEVVVTIGAWLLGAQGTLDVRVDGRVARSVPFDVAFHAKDPQHREPLQWEIRVPRSEIGAGTHRIESVITTTGGVAQSVSEEITLDHEVALGGIDGPADNALIGDDVLRVGGWFRSAVGYDGVEVTVAGRTERARLMSEHRRDIADATPDVDAPLAGWIATLDLAGLGTELEVVAEAFSDAGHREEIGRRTLRHRPPSRVLSAEEADRVAVLRARTDATLDRTPTTPRAADRPLRVLVAAHHLGIGGGQLYLHELMLRMRDAGPIEFVVLASADGPLRDQLETLGIEVRIVGTPPGHGLRHEEWIRQIGAVAIDDDVDAVLANTAATYWGVDLAERLGVPAVWTVHESFPVSVFLDAVFGEARDPYVRARFDAAFATAAKVVFVADATAALYTDLTRDNTMVVDYGVPLPTVDNGDPETRRAQRNAARERLGLDPTKRLLVTVGNVEPRKAQGLLVAAYARVAADFPDSELAIVGDSPSDYSSGLHEVVSRSGVGRAVHVIPLVEDVEDWYIAADAFVLGSDIESLPRSMLDAMVHGVPVVGTAVFGVPTLVQDGVNGILFEPSSISAFAEAIRKVLSLTPEELQTMSTAAFETVRTTRDSRTYGREYTALLHEITGR